MRKLISLLLGAATVLTFASCGAGESELPPSPTLPDTDGVEVAESTLHFAPGESLKYEEEFTAEDGTVLLSVAYELPQLELRTAEGAVYSLPPTANTADVQPKEVAVRDTFNAEMAKRFEDAKKDAVRLLEDAREHYAMLEEEYREYWGEYHDELRGEVGYMTEGLVSVSANAYGYYGGAHPMSGNYCWNFDLTTGEFLTLDALDTREYELGALGETLTHTIALYLLDEIEREGLQEEYYEDYYSYIFDLAANANFAFTEDGMRVIFDQYVIAPYAAGEQVFEVPYHVFYHALDEHTKALLEVDGNEVVLADYKCAEKLWAWFYLGEAPVDTGTAGAMSNGVEYYRVSCGALNSLEGLRALAGRYVSDEVADEWLGTGQFIEVNGALYSRSEALTARRETNGEILAVTGDTVTETVLDADGGTRVYEYPFTVVDGRAVFSAFARGE